MLIPVLIVSDMREAIAFHTGILDFELVLATPPEAPFYAILKRGADEMHMNLTHERNAAGQSSSIIICEDVDALFESFVARGLSVPTRADSPVHQRPLDQTWGTREVYVDDPSGNTIIFQQR